MSVIWVRAAVNCDVCGKLFRVELDPETRISDWTLIDEIEDRVRAGAVIGQALPDASSVQNGMMLCADCTRVADAGMEE